MVWIISALAAASVWWWLRPEPHALASSHQSGLSTLVRRRSLASGSPPSGRWNLRLPGTRAGQHEWIVQEQTAQSVRKVAALMRAGVPPVKAWELMAQHHVSTGANGESAQEFALVAKRVSAAMRLGLEPDQPLQKASRDSGDLWSRLSWCVSLSKKTGTPLSTLFEKVAADETDRADRGRALESILAGPKTTRRLLSWLPAAGVAMAQLLGAGPLAVLFGSPFGLALLVGGCLLWFANLWWSNRLLQQVLR
ncbi:type II secretion system F family protein [Neomicrococcus aestuarii]|uniref:type II secretion system F family protein n=1 Tax=Neomicrococcus aestuarii TaxID=556325 RepID=UPI0012ECC686|nr:type II secretion system F family protein [Neomicrococcus aestuarii]